MGLFDKKTCDVCGGKIGLLGNRKLEDGNLCKDCASQLSPWFEGRRHSTLADIKNQLAAREANKAKVASFTVGKKLGKHSPMLFVDTVNGTFAVCAERDLTSGNPDIIPLSAITGVTTETKEYKHEEKYKDSNGNMVSYTPPKYEYSYDYFCTITVDHPYIDDINFRLNDTTLKSGGLGTLGLRQNMSNYDELCSEIKATLKSTATAAPAATATSGAKVKTLEMKNLSVVYRCELEGVSYAIPMGIVGTVQCNTTLPDLDAEMEIKTMIISAMDALQEGGYGADEVYAKTAPFKFKIQTVFDNEAHKIGMGIIAFDLEAKFNESDIPTLKAMNNIRTNVAGTATEAAAMASGEWNCPSCGGKNTGNFCIYCGGKRA